MKSQENNVLQWGWGVGVDHFFFFDKYSDPASQVALVVKNPPASAGDIRAQVPSLGQEDPLEEGMATHSSILA